MAAVTKAYKEIISNALTESAARVVVAERKLAMLQQSLGMAKDGAVAMFVRLKAAMDAKLKEAEQVNMSQGRKIKELESQLNEAKATIDCLRSNLKKANLELENKNNRAELSDEQSTGANGTLAPDIDHGPMTVPNAKFRCIGSSAHIEFSKKTTPSDDSAGNPELASMILRYKKPKLYCNGCTQRIHAVERSRLTGKEAPAEEHNVKSKTVRCKKGKAEAAITDENTLASKKVVLMKKPLKPMGFELTGSISDSGCATGFLNQHFSKKQRSRRKHKSDHPMFHALVDTALKYQELSDTNYPKTDGISCTTSSGETVPEVVREGSQMTVSSTLPQVLEGNSKVVKNEIIKMNKSPNSESSHLVDSYRMITKQATGKQENAPAKDNIGTNYAVVGKLHCFKRNVNTLLDEDASKDAQVKECSILTALEQKKEEDLDTNKLKENHITFTNNGSGSELCRPSEPPPAVGGVRVLKYTFQRKRKRESSVSGTEIVHLQGEKENNKKVDSENPLLEPQKPSLLIESSRDNRRLAQVARQLISLSEKRWW